MRKRTVFGVLICLAGMFLRGCGYSNGEKERMEDIERQGRENAVNYVEEKYGFTPEIEDVKICTERGDSDPLPWANGYVLAWMSYGNEKFKVHISGQESFPEGRDDYQRELIMGEGRAYFEDLLGYEIYDMYLEYREESGDNSFPPCHEDGMLCDKYETGGFEGFLRKHPVNIRIDDCTDRDLTKLEEENPDAAGFFREYARDFGMKAILISYKSPIDYEKGYGHTYGRGGVMDFDIWNDGLYINSYGVFEQEKQEMNRFELKEQDGLIFGCLDRCEGDDLKIVAGQREWMELGETKGEPVSHVYSVDRDELGEITVFMPTGRYGERFLVFIQHFEQEWRQYEANKKVTRDKEYVFVTYHGIPDSHFDLAVFEQGK